jgi:hypothetical protein
MVVVVWLLWYGCCGMIVGVCCCGMVVGVWLLGYVCCGMLLWYGLVTCGMVVVVWLLGNHTPKTKPQQPYHSSLSHTTTTYHNNHTATTIPQFAKPYQTNCGMVVAVWMLWYGCCDVLLWYGYCSMLLWYGCCGMLLWYGCCGMLLWYGLMNCGIVVVV